MQFNVSALGCLQLQSVAINSLRSRFEGGMLYLTGEPPSFTFVLPFLRLLLSLSTMASDYTSLPVPLTMEPKPPDQDAPSRLPHPPTVSTPIPTSPHRPQPPSPISHTTTPSQQHQSLTSMHPCHMSPHDTDTMATAHVPDHRQLPLGELDLGDGKHHALPHGEPHSTAYL